MARWWPKGSAWPGTPPNGTGAVGTPYAPPKTSAGTGRGNGIGRKACSASCSASYPSSPSAGSGYPGRAPSGSAYSGSSNPVSPYPGSAGSPAYRPIRSSSGARPISAGSTVSRSTPKISSMVSRKASPICAALACAAWSGGSVVVSSPEPGRTEGGSGMTMVAVVIAASCEGSVLGEAGEAAICAKAAAFGSSSARVSSQTACGRSAVDGVGGWDGSMIRSRAVASASGTIRMGSDSTGSGSASPRPPDCCGNGGKSSRSVDAGSVGSGDTSVTAPVRPSAPLTDSISPITIL